MVLVFDEQLTLGREYALLGDYPTSTLYFDALLHAIHKCVCGFGLYSERKSKPLRALCTGRASALAGASHWGTALRDKTPSRTSWRGVGGRRLCSLPR